MRTVEAQTHRERTHHSPESAVERRALANSARQAVRSGRSDSRLYRRDAVLAGALDEDMPGDSTPLAELPRARSQEYADEDITRQEAAAHAAQNGGGRRQLLRARLAHGCGRRRRRRCGWLRRVLRKAARPRT